MTNLAIGRMDLPDEQGWLALNGSTVMDGLVDSQYQFQPSDEQITQENVLLRLRGSAAQLRTWLDRLEQFQLQPCDLFLRIWSDDHNSYGHAHIHKISLETQPGHLPSHERGSLQLKLSFLRETLFFGEEKPLPLRNSSGGGQTSGLTISNHDDSTIGHDNWFGVDNADLQLLYPALTRFQFENNFNGADLDDFWVGSLPCGLGNTRPTLNLEAENGIGGTVVSNSQASAGKYCQYRWSGSGWQTLSSWVLGPLEVSQLTGGTDLPLLRFFNTPSSSSLQLRIAINVMGKLVFEGPACYHRSGKGFSSLEPLGLPLGQLPLEDFACHHQLVLQAKQTDVGEHLLELDDLLLLPQHGFVQYHALGGLACGSKLVEDQITGKSWSWLEGMEFKSHSRAGTGLELLPTIQQHYWCFQTGSDGKATIDRTLSVRAWYRQQWRLP